MANELILIIEDNEKNRKLVRDVLQVKGYTDHRVRDGRRRNKARAGTISCSHFDGYPTPRDRRDYGSEATSGRPENEKHTSYCNYGFGDDPQ